MATARSTTARLSRWHLICPFLVILLLHTLGIYLFTRGFLLTRTELSAHSLCTDAAALSHCHSPSPPSSTAFGCWTPAAVRRVVIVVLDALRFDFVAPSTFFDEKKPWMDKLRVLQKLAVSSDRPSARIFKAIADPPTTSLQRLKGLTTGGLPTFIDIGNSFGAPAIAEDNLIHQLVNNGKRVLMMGDDTWLQLFPNHFQESYPYPSFNVKDLDTVDNGVNEHLIPSLYRDDWDVLVAHFLGVDHAGHIFGVDSAPMMQKLEQYNRVLEKVVQALKNQSEPGDLHEDTLLLVMGDHGQTINGDHGGGTAEEVETALFAMSMKTPPTSASSILDSRTCNLDLDGEKICISTFQQLDFAVSVASLLGIPFPFGSIGRVNAELYALNAGTWNRLITDPQKLESGTSCLDAWMQGYANTLCINSWQVKRYLEQYVATSVIGLPFEDLHHILGLYNQAQAKWSNTINQSCPAEDDIHYMNSNLQMQIDAYSSFLENVSQLARTAWTEFNMVMMGAGLGVLLVSIFTHLLYIGWLNRLSQSLYPPLGIRFFSISTLSALFFTVVRATSFLSNSYILEEGRVANFLLGTSGILSFLYSTSKGKFCKVDVIFLILNTLLRLGMELGGSKQDISAKSLTMLGINKSSCFWFIFQDILPIFTLFFVAYMIYKCVSEISCGKLSKHLVLAGSMLSYILIAVHWVAGSNWVTVPMFVQDLGKNLVPRLVYAIGFSLLVLLVVSRIIYWKAIPDLVGVTTASLLMVTLWSPTILILLGRQGPFALLLGIAGAWCIKQSHKQASIQLRDGPLGVVGFEPIRVVQWNLLAVCLYFYTGHWCTFDGLRYGAAFTGFENFQIVQQGLLLAIDTFGISHIIPIFSLPLLVTFKDNYSRSSGLEDIYLCNLIQVFLGYGLITNVFTTFTVICVTIQRRHLMVWGLFAPKYVFDVVGLLVMDILIFLASIYYY